MIVKEDEINVCVNKRVRFSFEDDDNLLCAMEKQALEVHYHCREGFCGACRVKLLKGKVHYKIEPLACIDDDEILACCCVPVSNIEVQTY